MKLDNKIYRVGRPVDITVIREVLARLPESTWHAWQYRRQYYVEHAATNSIPFAFLENGRDPANPEFDQWFDQPQGLRDAVLPIAQAIADFYQGRIVKLMLVRLPAGMTIPVHTDSGNALTQVHRCHLPIVTDPKVAFWIEGEEFYLEPGWWYEIDNTRQHAVNNRSGIDRIHLMCDIYSPR